MRRTSDERVKRDKIRRTYTRNEKRFCRHPTQDTSNRCAICGTYTRSKRRLIKQLHDILRENSTHKSLTTSYVTLELKPKKLWLRLRMVQPTSVSFCVFVQNNKYVTQELSLEHYDRKKWVKLLNVLRNNNVDGETLYVKLNRTIAGVWFSEYKPWLVGTTYARNTSRGKSRKNVTVCAVGT